MTCLQIGTRNFIQQVLLDDPDPPPVDEVTMAVARVVVVDAGDESHAVQIDVTIASAERVVPLNVGLHVSRVGRSTSELSFRDSSRPMSALEKTRLVVLGA